MTTKRLKFAFERIIGGVWGDEPQGNANDIICVRVADFDDVTGCVSTESLTLRHISPSEQNGRLLRQGDLLLEKSGGGEQSSVGRTVRFTHDFPAVCSNFIGLLRPKQPNDPTFLTYLMRAMYQGGGSLPHIKQTTGIQNLDCDSFLNIVFAFPSPPIQRDIAAFLDDQTAKIDRLMALRRRQMELLREQRASIIQQAVIRGLDPNVPTKDTGIQWIQDIPAHWEIKPLGSVTIYISYGFTNPMPGADEGPYLLTANDIGEGTIRYATARHTTQDAFDTLLTNKSRPKEGDILVTKDGTLGRVALCDGQRVCINQSVALLRLDERQVDLPFVVEALQAHPYQENMVYDAGGTTIKHIYITRLVKMRMAFPPKPEQKEIHNYLSEETGAIDRITTAYARQLGMLAEYRTALIHECVTGQRRVTVP
jgi:type I restriction enzyme S subunit